METNVCNYCHRMFQSAVKMTACPECRHIDNKKFEPIYDYLIEHPLSNAIQISNAIGSDINDILRFIDEGRLQIVDKKQTDKK